MCGIYSKKQEMLSIVQVKISYVLPQKLMPGCLVYAVKISLKQNTKLYSAVKTVSFA